jgi:RNA polymerase sigma-70 factor (ECF subfamily)
MTNEGGTVTLQDAELPDVHQHRRYLLALARMQLRDAAAAEDVVQDTLEAALRSVGSFRNQSSVRTWLTGILRHKILDVLRVRKRQPTPTYGLEVPERARAIDSPFDDTGTWSRHPQHWNVPDEAAAQTDFLRVLQECLSKMPASVARAFYLREVMEVETKEITEALDITANHLGVLMYRARLLLRECLESRWFQRDTLT